MTRSIEFISFEEVLPYWHELWPDRESPIESTSWMTLSGSTQDFSQSEAFFLAWKKNDEIVGVNSFHIAEYGTFGRSRGLWVKPEFRGKGIGTELLEMTCDFAWRMKGIKLMWSFSRKTSFKTYEAAGFSRVSPCVDTGEFGPNCYVVKML